MAFRGPDAQRTWHDEHAGLAHALLATNSEEVGRAQPASPDGEVWLTGDVRLDARHDLVHKLVGAGRDASLAQSDAELVMHAYALWSELCIEHLAGDFAFSIWNRRTCRLFAARDQFGVSPFFFARSGEFLLFSNTLEAILLHPGVPDVLNERAMGDFLVSGWIGDGAATVFAAIDRLPPAHCLTWSPAGNQVRRYWTVPAPGPLLR